MKPFLISTLLIFLILFSGCNSYISRTILQSLERIGDNVPDSKYTITTPILPDVNLAISWIGHATVLIQIHDKIIITDPLFSNNIGMMVKRNVKSALDPALLKKVDFTLISHMHFDHFSYGSLDQLPKDGYLIIPDGLIEYTPDFGFRQITEMKPWETIEEEGVRITAVPAQHFSGRYGFDGTWMKDRGYTGYIVEYKGITIFFAGDTGYNPDIFQEIGNRFKIDLAIIPIAPGSLNSLGSRVHVGPIGALKIFEEVKAKYMIPIHFGTLLFGSNSNPDAVLETLREAAKKDGLSDRMIIMDFGQQKILF